jgi:hypothetical protein
MKLAEAKKKYLFTTQIEFPVNGKLPEDTTEESGFVVLREPDIEEIGQLGNDEKSNLENIKKLFPKCIIEHPFVNEDGTKATIQDVAAMLKASSSLYTYLIQTWFATLPFPSQKEK